jgi:TetR/AcrR family transcriptional repressor of nem operon
MARPREFDETALVSQAMQAFWTRGYRGMSIEELVSQTGVSRASLYSVYPDKRKLFVEGIKRYLDEVVQGNVRRLYETEPAGEAVRQFFLKAVEAPYARLQRGCLLTNTAVELGVKDKEISGLIRQAFLHVEDALHERLTEAKKAGELAANIAPRSYARQLIALLQGIRVMARVGVDRDTLRDAVRAGLSPLASAARSAKVRPAAPRARHARAGKTSAR